jgi:hypothetical protein
MDMWQLEERVMFLRKINVIFQMIMLSSSLMILSSSQMITPNVKDYVIIQLDEDETRQGQCLFYIWLATMYGITFHKKAFKF